MTAPIFDFRAFVGEFRPKRGLELEGFRGRLCFVTVYETRLRWLAELHGDAEATLKGIQSAEKLGGIEILLRKQCGHLLLMAEQGHHDRGHNESAEEDDAHHYIFDNVLIHYLYYCRTDSRRTPRA